MRKIAADNAVCVTCASALLLLLAAQQKVCAGAELGAAERERANTDAIDPIPSDPEHSKKDSEPEPLTFADTLPDPAPTRWLGSGRIGGADTPEHRAARAWMADAGQQATAANPVDPDSPSFSACPQSDRRRLLFARVYPPERIAGAARATVATLFHSTILRTGPPHD